MTWSIDKKGILYIWSAPEENEIMGKIITKQFEEIIAGNLKNLRKSQDHDLRCPIDPKQESFLGMQ